LDIVYYLLGLWLAVMSFAGQPREIMVAQTEPTLWVNVSRTTGDSHSPAMNYSERLGHVIAWVDETRGPEGEVYFAYQIAAGWVNAPIPHTVGGYQPDVHVVDGDVRICFLHRRTAQVIDRFCTTFLAPGWSSVDRVDTFALRPWWLPLVAAGG